MSIRCGRSDFEGVYGHMNKGETMERWSRAMGIDWMGRRDIVLAVPPVYAEAIGRAAIALLEAATWPSSAAGWLRDPACQYDQ